MCGLHTASIRALLTLPAWPRRRRRLRTARPRICFWHRATRRSQPCGPRVSASVWASTEARPTTPGIYGRRSSKQCWPRGCAMGLGRCPCATPCTWPRAAGLRAWAGTTLAAWQPERRGTWRSSTARRSRCRGPREISSPVSFWERRDRTRSWCMAARWSETAASWTMIPGCWRSSTRASRPVCSHEPASVDMGSHHHYAGDGRPDRGEGSLSKGGAAASRASGLSARSYCASGGTPAPVGGAQVGSKYRGAGCGWVRLWRSMTMRKIVTRRLLLGALCLAIVGGVSLGAARGTTLASSPAKHTRALTDVTFILNWLPNVEFSGLWVAQKFHWWEKAGLSLHFKPYANRVNTGTGVP